MKGKSILTFLFALGISRMATAQQRPDTAIAVMTYAFSHVRDSTNAAHPYTENMNMFLGKRSSLYKTADREIADSLAMASYNASGGKSITVTKLYNHQQYYMYPDVHQVYVFEHSYSDYIMPDEWPAINWKITEEMRTISELNCQKAVGSWRGRTYEAWFCPDLPFHAGPCKLNGLPGLIVEAADTKKQVVFRFAGYKTLNNNKTIITLPEKGKAVLTTVAAYKQRNEAARQNPNAASGGKILSSSGPVRRGMNNPMELSKP